ncbi:MAG: SRPBCC domain-containing protein [Parvibaculaceae bacterium]
MASIAETHALLITRSFDAPRALVFKVWSAPEHVARWWGPKDFVVLEVKLDFRLGGGWRVGMRSPDGKDYWASGIYREIKAPERLVFTFAWDEFEDQPTHEMLVTIGFEDVGGRQTRMRFRQAPFRDVESRDSHVEGWSESFDRMQAFLASMPA